MRGSIQKAQLRLWISKVVSEGTLRVSSVGAFWSEDEVSWALGPALDGAVAYTPLQFLTDLRRGIWSGVATPARPIDQFRRNVQIVYLDIFDNRLNGGPALDSAVRGLLRGELRALRAQVVAALPSAADRSSRLHLEEVRDRIDEILDPRAMRPRTPAAAGRGGAAAMAGSDYAMTVDGVDFGDDMFLRVPETCWPDYVIR